MKKYLIVFFLEVAVCMFALPALAQNQPPQPVFSCSTDAVGIRANGATNPGTDVACSLNITKTIAAETHNILTPSTGAQDYFGGLSYSPDFSKLIGKTNLPKNTFRPFIHGAFGVSRNVPAVGAGTQGYGGFIGGGVRYDPTGSGRFTVTPIRVDFYDHSGLGKSPHGVLFGAGIQYVFGTK